MLVKQVASVGCVTDCDPELLSRYWVPSTCYVMLSHGIICRCMHLGHPVAEPLCSCCRSTCNYRYVFGSQAGQRLSPSGGVCDTNGGVLSGAGYCRSDHGCPKPALVGAIVRPQMALPTRSIRPHAERHQARGKWRRHSGSRSLRCTKVGVRDNNTANAHASCFSAGRRTWSPRTLKHFSKPVLLP